MCVFVAGGGGVWTRGRLWEGDNGSHGDAKGLNGVRGAPACWVSLLSGEVIHLRVKFEKTMTDSLRTTKHFQHCPKKKKKQLPINTRLLRKFFLHYYCLKLEKRHNKTPLLSPTFFQTSKLCPQKAIVLKTLFRRQKAHWVPGRSHSQATGT